MLYGGAFDVAVRLAWPLPQGVHRSLRLLMRALQWGPLFAPVCGGGGMGIFPEYLYFDGARDAYKEASAPPALLHSVDDLFW